ncbi:MAG TPA: biotin/lipoyl-containing protein, partial [Dongiaceae bacterium]|nr:biotin/lipoyl-containing protein [Dongiaceae bacterium]
MSTQVLMPALSPTMTEGKLSKWLKAKGDNVKAGDILAEIETDKATMEVEAVDEGVLDQILVPEGTENVAVNTPIAVLRGEDEAAGATPASPPTSKPQANVEGKTEAKGAEAPKPAAPAKAPALPAAVSVAAEPEYSGPTATQTVREALRDA